MKQEQMQHMEVTNMVYIYWIIAITKCKRLNTPIKRRIIRTDK